MIMARTDSFAVYGIDEAIKEGTDMQRQAPTSYS
jgi:2-methylisocitrate lyase-like PEP mutase family enzyme